ncbi:MAG: hypothetical protein RDV48_25285 [Candidatus Eremiobacteraeota bacterium]|nr:hypothetical protein [Candidatus Eremiobacteraeota bacterium]
MDTSPVRNVFPDKLKWTPGAEFRETAEPPSFPSPQDSFKAGEGTPQSEIMPSFPEENTESRLTVSQKAMTGLLLGLSVLGAAGFNAVPALAAPFGSQYSREKVLPFDDSGSFPHHGSGFEDPSPDEGGSLFKKGFQGHTYADSRRLAAEYGRKLYERVKKEGMEDQAKVLNFHDRGAEGYDYEYISVPDALFSESASVLPDHTGKIGHFAFQLDGNLRGKVKEQVLEAYRTYLETADKDVKFTFVVEASEDRAALEKTIKDLKLENPGRIKVVPAGGNVSLWIRDSMIPARNSDGSPVILRQDRDYWSAASDRLVPQRVQEGQGLPEVKDLPFIRIDGGNMVAAKDAVFIGAESVKETAEQLQFYRLINKSFDRKVMRFYENRTGTKLEKGPDFGQLLREVVPEVFHQTFQKKVFVVGMDNPATPQKEQQPTFHIDMALTPLDDSTVLVGDPSLGVRLLEGMSKEEWKGAVKSLQASCDCSENALTSILEKNREGTSSREGAEAFQHNFDAVAKDMEARGFRVIRAPYLRQPYVGVPIVTYNNVMMESYKSPDGSQVKRVYLPVYGIKALDTFAQSIYREQGFEVIPIPSSAISGMQGAVRCLTQAIERSPS